MNSLVSPQNSILAKSLVTSICALTLLALSGCEAMIEALEVFKYERDDDDWYFTDPNKLMHYYVLSRLTDETEYRPLLKEKMENHSTPNLIQKADKLYDAYVNEFGKPQ